MLEISHKHNITKKSHNIVQSEMWKLISKPFMIVSKTWKYCHKCQNLDNNLENVKIVEYNVINNVIEDDHTAENNCKKFGSSNGNVKSDL